VEPGSLHKYELRQRFLETWDECKHSVVDDHLHVSD